MSDYKAVSDALKRGTEPALLCETCPWDRYCITPPSMTSQDVEEQIAKATRQDEERLAKAKAEGKEAGMPVGSLLTALVVGGNDTKAQICPVFALRFRSSQGQRIAADTKALMQGWDDER